MHKISQKEYRYDVALSFAGEDREYVEEVALLLKRFGVKVFYDKFEESNLWGKNLYSYLNEIYKEKARFTIMFISKHYRDKVWTNHERQSIQERAFRESSEYILPARFDDTEIPGLYSTISYINLVEKQPEEFVNVILKKLNPSEDYNIILLFFREAFNNMSTLTKDVDHANPVWLCRGEKGYFDNYDIQHGDLLVDVYDKYHDKVIDTELYLYMETYYRNIKRINKLGAKLCSLNKTQDYTIEEEIDFDNYIRDMALYIERSEYLCEQLLNYLMKSNIGLDYIKIDIDNYKEAIPYALSVAKTVHLDLPKLVQLFNTDEEVNIGKYPARNYLESLYVAAYQWKYKTI